MMVVLATTIAAVTAAPNGRVLAGTPAAALVRDALSCMTELVRAAQKNFVPAAQLVVLQAQGYMSAGQRDRAMGILSEIWCTYASH